MFGRQPSKQFTVGNEGLIASCRLLDLLWIQGSVIETSFVDDHGKVLVATLGCVTQAKEHRRFALGESGQVFLVRFAVRLTVAIKGNPSIRFVGHDQMNHLVDQILRRGTGEILSSTEAVAAGNPMPGHSFSQNDRIEEITRTLNAHDPTSSLIKIFKKKPNFEALGPQFEREVGAP